MSEGAFELKLEELAARRLRQGQTRSALLAELTRKLDPAQAQRVVSRAEESIGPLGEGGYPAPQLAPAVADRPDRTETILAGFVYLWGIMLSLQCVAILVGIRQAVPRWSQLGERRVELYRVILTLLALISAGIFYALSKGGRTNSFVYAGALLFAYPIGRFVCGPLQPERAPTLSNLLSLDSVFAASAVGIIGYLYLRRQAARRRAPRIDAFD